MVFSSIPGQQVIKDYFTKIVNENRVPHAQLMVGGEGHGKLALAIALANYLQCQDKAENGPCGQCRACHKSSQYIHPDIHFAFPVVKKDKLKREDTTSNDFLPEWRDFLKTNPFGDINNWLHHICLLYTSPSPRDLSTSRMPSSA